MNIMTPMKQIYALRALRVARGLTQRGLAESSGIASRTISSAENGVDVSLESLRSIAAALGIATVEAVAAYEADRASALGSQNGQ